MKKFNPFSIPITPIIAALIPVAFLAAANIKQIDKSDISRSFFFLFVFGIAVLLILRVITRSWTSASLIGGFFILLFFSYGHVYQWLEPRKLFLSHHSILFSLFLAVGGVITWVILRFKENARQLIVPINLILLVLFLFSAIPATTKLIQYDMELRNKSKAVVSAQAGLPDVYFIILDAYARNDVLQSKFGFDNSNFTGHLKDLGFSVIPCSQSNYQITMISILSTLSMDYISDTPTDTTKQGWSSDITIEREKIIHNPVRTKLEGLGYTTVSFESAYPWSETPDVDYYYKVDLNHKYSVLNKFETILLNSSMGILYTEYSKRFISSGQSNPINLDTFDESAEYYYLVHRNTLDKLDTVAQLKSPKYVYAHLGAPHEPYVLAQDGSFALGTKHSGDPYINQLIYVNKRITKIVETILRESKIPPIIILESDHGYDPKDKNTRLKNLMAFYAPEEIRNQLYPTMTPINSFRIVLNYLDGGSRPLLRDYSFFSPDMGKVDFELVPNQCQ